LCPPTFHWYPISEKTDFSLCRCVFWRKNWYLLSNSLWRGTIVLLLNVSDCWLSCNRIFPLQFTHVFYKYGSWFSQ
jgi:hypothetical protein